MTDIQEKTLDNQFYSSCCYGDYVSVSYDVHGLDK